MNAYDTRDPNHTPTLCTYDSRTVYATQTLRNESRQRMAGMSGLRSLSIKCRRTDFYALISSCTGRC